ncbi:MAG: adenosylmethionine decarboxylase [Abditibacteriales bacterium]|nr:adenosylmethionine decarboxylase [Abditibacteriales bacterium]MDW8364805.1 adenosylmethionine decarboxylase [Abditibacteriales bacterium]
MIGHHLLADLYGVTAKRLKDEELLLGCLVMAAVRCGLTPVAEPVIHCFAGGGITGFLLLAESHIAFHTYPERGFIALDIFSCGDADPHAALKVFREALRPQQQQVHLITRGGDVA